MTYWWISHEKSSNIKNGLWFIQSWPLFSDMSSLIQNLKTCQNFCDISKHVGKILVLELRSLQCHCINMSAVLVPLLRHSLEYHITHHDPIPAPTHVISIHLYCLKYPLTEHYAISILPVCQGTMWSWLCNLQSSYSTFKIPWLACNFRWFCWYWKNRSPWW